jgi:hypothetical protein
MKENKMLGLLKRWDLIIGLLITSYFGYDITYMCEGLSCVVTVLILIFGISLLISVPIMIFINKKYKQLSKIMKFIIQTISIVIIYILIILIAKIIFN